VWVIASGTASGKVLSDVWGRPLCVVGVAECPNVCFGLEGLCFGDWVQLYSSPYDASVFVLGAGSVVVADELLLIGGGGGSPGALQERVGSVTAFDFSWMLPAVILAQDEAPPPIVGAATALYPPATVLSFGGRDLSTALLRDTLSRLSQTRNVGPQAAGWVFVLVLLGCIAYGMVTFACMELWRARCRKRRRRSRTVVEGHSLSEPLLPQQGGS
jgi:hypothetical protein